MFLARKPIIFGFAVLLNAAHAQEGAEFCFPPAVPSVPTSSEHVHLYSDLLKRDFEDYFANVEDYIRCLDWERNRAFEEARNAAQTYGRLLESQSD